MGNAIYANARAAALSKNLLGKERINRLLEASSVEDAVKILAEVGFGDGIKLESVSEFEKIIEIEESKFFGLLKEQGIDQNVASFFLLKNDYHNAEAFIKCKHLKKEENGMCVSAGLIDLATLKERIFTDDYATFFESMKNALLSCDEQFTSGKATGASVNAVFTKAYFEHLFNFAKNDEYLKKIYSFKVDCVNIGTALRSRKYLQAKDWFLSHGTLSEKDLRALCEDSLENLKETFRFTEYNQAVSLAVDAKLKNQPLSEFEKLTDEFALNFINKKRYETKGLVLLIKYCLQRRAEISSVRQILVGIANGLDKNVIRNKLREIYEG